jgi:hypothetical protein
MRINLYFCNGFIIFLIISTCLSCRKDSITPSAELKPYTGNLKFEFLTQSREKIFSSQMPWELRSLNYFNVVQRDSALDMWYTSFAYNQLEFNGSFCIANSKDGENWNRPFINSNTNILVAGNNAKGISGACVFRDKNDNQYPYKMICLKLVDNNQKTFLYGSADGINWIQIKKLFDQKQDSQFSIINIGDEYYVFLRYNDYSKGYQRAIGLAKLDNELNVVQQPQLLLEAPANDIYPHIYNSAASKINDSVVVLLPTYYDDVDGRVKIKLIYTKNMKEYYLVNSDINDYLFPGQDVNWAIVSPGITPSGEPNTYWVYYFQTSSKHNSIANASNINVVYYRIKLKVSF